MHKKVCLIFSILIITIGCTRDIGYLPFCDANPSRFNTNIKPIILTKCATIGCHTNGFALGDFNTYSEIKSKIDKGSFQNFVFTVKIMPPASSEQLTEDEYKKIKCWLDDGAPEN